MGTPNKLEQPVKLTRQEKIQLVKDKIDEVNKELGPDIAPHISRRKICDMVLTRLPLQPMYDSATVEMIMSGTYK